MSTDPAGQAGYRDHPPRMGFFTDTSVCIGCKACEVACKEWNAVPEDGLAFLGTSYDNTGALGASTWRHVAFVEQSHDGGVRWLMSSDVCKHCSSAACLDVCPTGALIRIEFGPLLELRDRAEARLATLHASGEERARLYGEDPADGVGGFGAFFLLLDEPEVYGLPPAPASPTRDLPSMWRSAALAALSLAACAVGAFLGGRRLS